MSPDELAEQILAIADPGKRRVFLAEQRERLTLEVIENLKAHSDALLLRDPNESLHIAAVAQEAAALVADDLALAVALWARGNALFYLNEHREAVACYRQAQLAYAARGRKLEVARLQVNQIFPLLQLGQYAEAIRVAREARITLEPMGPTRYLATLEMNISSVYRQINDYEQALAACTRGREIFAALGDVVQSARMDVNRANALENMDRFKEAGQLLESARAVLVANDVPQEAARVELNLGVLAFRQGQYQAALRWLEQARDGFASLKNKLEMTEVDLYRSYVYLALNLLPETLELATQVERAFSRRGMKRQAALAAINKGIAHRQLGEELAAMHCFMRARRIFKKRGAMVEVALLDLERATLLRTAGSAREAHRIAGDARAIFTKQGLVVRCAQADLLQAECAIDLNKTAEAETLARAALQVADQFKLTALAYRSHHILGRASEQGKKVREAFGAYRAAVEAIEALRATLRVDEFRAGFLADKLAIYEDAVRLALALGRVEEAFALTEQANAAMLIGLAPDGSPLETADEADRRIVEELDSLRRAWHWTHTKLEGSGDALSDADRDRSANVEQHLQNQLSTLEGQIAELARRWQIRRTWPDALTNGALCSLGEIQRCLAPEAALAQYFVVRNKLVALVVRADSTSCITDLSPLSALERLLDSWRFSLESLKLYPPEAIQSNLDNLCADAQAHLRRLYDALIAPLEDRLGSCQQMYIVPHLALPDVPFCALYDGNRYLIERCEITHLPMASVLARQRRLAVTNNSLVMGYSDGGRLRFAVAEAERVAAVLAQSQSPVLRVEENATESEFRAHTRQCSVLHLATHAAFRPDNPFFSWVRLADARLTVADLYGMALPHQPLVVLSACETALGGRRGGGLIGMGRSLLAAGASALVVSLWKVDDASTAQFMEHFYKVLQAGQSVSAALRMAQLETLARYRHPFYWAPFILVQGNRA